MAMKPKTKPASKKSAPKKPAAPTAKPPGRPPQSGSKYDQTGAPWWKKFRPSEIRT